MGSDATRVVTCFLREGVDVLLGRRRESAETYPGRWGGVSGYVEDGGDGGTGAVGFVDAVREVREETGQVVGPDDLVRAGDPLPVTDGDRRWAVHPFLFAVGSRAVDGPDDEFDGLAWLQPPAILDGRPTVPGLWAAYERVAPTVADVREDAVRGSAALSVRALTALRDRAASVAAGVDGSESTGDAGVDGSESTGDAGVDGSESTGDADDPVVAVARALRDARPSMAVVANRVNRVLADATTPAGVRDRAAEAIEAALEADAAAAAATAGLLDAEGVRGVATLSRSGTVLAALREARPAVLVGESRPGGEGVAVAEALADAGLTATLTPDAALPALVAGVEAAPAPDGDPDATPPVDAVLLGADAVLADGRVVNKVGSRALAVAAAREGVPVLVAAARDKVRSDARVHGEASDPATVYAGDDDRVRVHAPTFDVTPAAVVDAVVTEDGPLDAGGVRAAAAAHRAAARWDPAVGGGGADADADADDRDRAGDP